MRETFTEAVGLVAQIAPASIAVGTVDSTVFALNSGKVIAVVVQAGVLGAAATVDGILQVATTSGGSYGNVTGIITPQLVKATDDNRLAIVEFSTDRIKDLVDTANFGRFRITVAGAASILGVQIWAFKPPYKPATNMAALKAFNQFIN